LNDLEEARKVAEEFGYPVLLKASAGGGGKGMRKVSAMDELANAFEAIKRESLNAFGDDSIYLEKFIQNPRHIEVQVFADKKGNYRHLFERECSIQRRHQKIIEEAPSVFVDPKTRDRITEAALNTAKSCDYFNAGTVEFLMDEQKNFYFLEMNTRLQVEHPVTEMITSTDLVKEQISVAAGNKISFEQKDMRINGSAIECRICAEDPFNDFLPSAGKIMSYHQPSGPGVRIDEGFTSGSEISVYYDSLIAKLVCHGSEREIALGKIKRALDEFNIAGIVTNIPFLKSLFRNSNFIKGEFDISFIEKEMNVITPENSNGIEQAASIISAYLMKMQNQDSRAADKSAKNRWSEQLND
jgi:acetyl/propionyl-CoA carboxylase alpha subunit